MPKIKVVGQTVQKLERQQTNGRTDGHDQTYYLPGFAVDNEGWEVGQLSTGHYTFEKKNMQKMGDPL